MLNLRCFCEPCKSIAIVWLVGGVGGTVVFVVVMLVMVVSKIRSFDLKLLVRILLLADSISCVLGANPVQCLETSNYF